jgi:hypothetical protein
MNRDSFDALLQKLVEEAREDMTIDEIYSVLQVQTVMADAIFRLEVEKEYKKTSY